MPRIAILGATGAVGEVVRQCLAERNFPASDLVFLASARSAGKRLSYAGEEIEVRAVSAEAFDDVEIAIFSAGATRSREWAPIAMERGVVVIDNSSAFRMRDDVPLVVAEVNPHALRGHHGLIANPNCSTMQLMPVLRPLRDAAGLEKITVATYQSVSGTGQRAIEGLRTESRAALAGEDVTAAVYPRQIAFNVLGFAGNFVGDEGYTDEELKLVDESRKILELPDLRVSVHCSRVPVIYGHSEAVWAETKEELSASAFRTLLEDAPGVIVSDEPDSFSFPSAIAAAGIDDVFVGRIRRDIGDPRTLAFWVVGDNLRKGAATNTVQIAELLVRGGLLARAEV